VQADGRLVNAKFPPASEDVSAEHPVLLPLSSTPKNITNTPAIGVCVAFETTVRPIKEVLIPATCSDAVADCVTNWPAIVAFAVTESVDVPVA